MSVYSNSKSTTLKLVALTCTVAMHPRLLFQHWLLSTHMGIVGMQSEVYKCSLHNYIVWFLRTWYIVIVVGIKPCSSF